MTATKFRKRPIEIEAWQFTRAAIGPQKAGPDPQWLADAINAGTVWYQGGQEPYFTIQTLEGPMRAYLDDWIIKGVKGELYPCKPDIFAATYDPLKPDKREEENNGR